MFAQEVNLDAEAAMEDKATSVDPTSSKSRGNEGAVSAPSKGPSEEKQAQLRESSPEEEVAKIAKEATEEALEKTVPSEPDDGRGWYVIQCYSGREQKIKQKLDRRIKSLGMEDEVFQVVIPTEDQMELHQGERRMVERRIFPGYLLVQMIMTDDSWYTVKDTPGVIGFVGMGSEPAPLKPSEVEGIIERMEAEVPKIKVTFEPGEKVRIIGGPFDGFIGVVDEIDMEQATVHVMVSFFGRETPVELDFLQVEKI